MSEHDEAMPACITCRPRGGGMSFPSRKPFLQGSWTTAEGDDGTPYVRAELVREAVRALKRAKAAFFALKEAGLPLSSTVADIEVALDELKKAGL